MRGGGRERAQQGRRDRFGYFVAARTRRYEERRIQTSSQTTMPDQCALNTAPVEIKQKKSNDRLYVAPTRAVRLRCTSDAQWMQYGCRKNSVRVQQERRNGQERCWATSRNVFLTTQSARNCPSTVLCSRSITALSEPYTIRKRLRHVQNPENHRPARVSAISIQNLAIFCVRQASDAKSWNASQAWV